MDNELKNFTIKARINSIVIQLTVAMILIEALFVYMFIDSYIKTGFSSDTFAMIGLTLMILTIFGGVLLQARFNYIKAGGNTLVIFDAIDLFKQKTEINLNELEGAWMEGAHGVPIIVIKEKSGKTARIATAIYDAEEMKKLYTLLAQLPVTKSQTGGSPYKSQ